MHRSPIRLSPNPLPLPKGYRCAAASVGIKDASKKKLDLAILVSDVPTAVAACFTTNRVKAAPVRVASAHLRRSEIRAVVVNSGNANACTGAAGVKAARKICKTLGKLLGLRGSQVFPCSTGIIGIPLPSSLIRDAMPNLVENLSADEWPRMAEAILTSDTRSKMSGTRVKVGTKTVTITGIAKGAGMINPNMATMLSFVMTDAAVDESVLRKLTSCAVDDSFNRITVDGDMSTNDTVVVMANGTAGNEVIKDCSNEGKRFRDAVTAVMLDLAKQIVRDGEKATRFIEIEVRGAANHQDAQKVAEALANSSLAKCSWNGGDPNWGRMMSAIGSAGVRMREEFVDIYLDGLQACRNGLATGTPIERLKLVMAKPEIKITIDLHIGDAGYCAYTTDLSEGYVAFNRLEYAAKVQAKEKNAH